jgi:hypothetical protein
MRLSIMNGNFLAHGEKSGCLLNPIAFRSETGIPHGDDGRDAVQGAGMIPRAVWTGAEWKRGTLTIERLFVRQSGLVLTLHII